MQQMTDNHVPFNPRRVVMARPRKRRKRWRPNWGILWVIVALLGITWLLHNIEPAVTWEELMNYLHVHNRERYSQLAILCIILTTICALWRIVKGKKDDS
jgi:hypothetical protein